MTTKKQLESTLDYYRKNTLSLAIELGAVMAQRDAYKGINPDVVPDLLEMCKKLKAAFISALSCSDGWDTAEDWQILYEAADIIAKAENA